MSSVTRSLNQRVAQTLHKCSPQSSQSQSYSKLYKIVAQACFHEVLIVVLLFKVFWLLLDDQTFSLVAKKYLIWRNLAKSGHTIHEKKSSEGNSTRGQFHETKLRKNFPEVERNLLSAEKTRGKFQLKVS